MALVLSGPSPVGPAYMGRIRGEAMQWDGLQTTAPGTQLNPSALRKGYISSFSVLSTQIKDSLCGSAAPSHSKDGVCSCGCVDRGLVALQSRFLMPPPEVTKVLTRPLGVACSTLLATATYTWSISCETDTVVAQICRHDR